MNAKHIQTLAIAYIALWVISPPLFASMEGRILVVLATTVWAAVEIVRPGGLARRVTLPVILALLFVAYTGFIEVLLYGAGGLVNLIQIWIMLFFLLVWQSRRNDLQSLVPVFWVVLIVHPIWQFITVQTITTENSHAARVLVRSSAESMELARQGVGGYGLVYGTLLLIPALIGIVRNRDVLRGAVLSKSLHTAPRLAFGIVILNIALGVVLVLTAGFSIAVIALAGILLSIALLKAFTMQRLLVILLTILVFAFFAELILRAALIALQPLAEGTNFSIKIRDVLASLELGNMTGTAEDRSERYLRSLRLFAENPLTGVLAFEDVGKHSEILDGLARWGVVFGGIFLYLVSFPSVRFIRQNKQDFGVGLSMLAAVVVIFGLNSGFAIAGLMLYIMFPVSQHMLRAGLARHRMQSAVSLNAS